MRYLLSSIAIAALAAATVQADPGGGKGHAGGNGGGNGSQAEAPRGGGNGADKGERGNGKAGGNGGGQAAAPQPNRGMSERNVRTDQGHADKQRQLPAQAQGEARGNNGNSNGNDVDRGESRGQGAGQVIVRNVQPARISWRDYDNHGLVTGCPPGLAKKHNGCMPPGLAKQDDLRRYDGNWFGLRGLSDSTGYRYFDGNLVRLTSNGVVSGYYPLLGGALAVGNPWPSGWQPTPLSSYYSDYYGLGNDYRYFDGAIYRVDPQTSAIQSVAALLTGDTFNVGQRMPLGYDAYNVPYSYRDRYADGPDSRYRYNDGYVYQVDTKTQLIVAAIELLS